MTPQDILNADLKTIAGWLRGGFAWWVGELAGLVPERLRQGARRRAPWTARVDADGEVTLWRDGRPTQALPPSPTAGWRADLVLPSRAALVRDLEAPRLSSADLRLMLSANMDRLTPFPAERVYFDAPVAAKPGEAGVLAGRLAVAPRERVLDALSRTRALGLDVERVMVEDGAQGAAFDLMPAVRADQGGGGVRRRTIWWGACAGLVALNVAAAIVMDARDVRRLEAAVEADQPKVAAAQRLRETVTREQAARLAVLTRRSQGEPLRIVDAVSKVLPDGQWAHRLEWNGRAVRIVGFKTQDFDVAAALARTPALSSPRSLLADMPVKTAAGVEPFDVIADSPTRAAK